MAGDLLQAKGLVGADAEVGEYWTNRFLQRHPDLKTKFVTGLDKQRRFAEDPTIITEYFTLYKDTVGKYQIHEEDIHNMDEKGMMLGVVGKVKVIISKHEKTNYIVQCGNRE
jgi:copper oxidase (laccase) domain-containing protein